MERDPILDYLVLEKKTIRRPELKLKANRITSKDYKLSRYERQGLVGIIKICDYSLLGSCRLANVNPQEWLTDVLNQIQGHSIQKLTELLPTHWRKNAI